MGQSFTKPVTIRFEHTDAEGIMFFGNIYGLIHEAYEEFVRHLGFEYRDWFQDKSWGIPIRKSECEYSAPLLPGKTYDIAVSIPQMSDSTFTTKYTVSLGGKVHCEAQLVHTFVDRLTRAKTSIPAHVRGKFEAYQAQSGLTK